MTAGLAVAELEELVHSLAAVGNSASTANHV
jgi:hypothetical protein